MDLTVFKGADLDLDLDLKVKLDLDLDLDLNIAGFAHHCMEACIVNTKYGNLGSMSCLLFASFLYLTVITAC